MPLNIPNKLQYLIFSIIILMLVLLLSGYKVQWQNGQFYGFGRGNVSLEMIEKGKERFEIKICGSHSNPCSIPFSFSFSEPPVCVVSTHDFDGTGYSTSVSIKSISSSELKIIANDKKTMYVYWMCHGKR